MCVFVIVRVCTHTHNHTHTHTHIHTHISNTQVLSLTSVKTYREDGIGCSVTNALELGPASKGRFMA